MASGLVATLNSLMAAAVAALAAGDYATALNNAIAAQGIAGSIPKLSRSAGTGGGSQAAEWNPQGIQDFVANIRRLWGSSLGVQSVPITIVEPVQTDDGSQFANSSGGYVQ